MLIKKVTLSNFQKHKHLSIDFTEGVNIIRGRSDIGKSAIIRAMIACITGKGFSLAYRTWETNEPMTVTIETDKHTVTRGRDEKSNYYIVDGKRFDALGKSVPDEVKIALPIGDNHFGRQFTAPYLIGATSSEVARTIQSVVDLEAINECIKNANGKIRESENKESNLRDLLHEVTISLEKTKEVPIFRKRFNHLARWSEACSQRRKKIGEYQAIIDGFGNLSRYENKARIANLRPDFEKCKAMLGSIEKRRAECLQREKLLARCLRYERSSARINEARKLLVGTKDIGKKVLELEDKKRKIVSYQNLISSYRENEENLKEARAKLSDRQQELEALKKKLKICPLCGGKL